MRLDNYSFCVLVGAFIVGLYGCGAPKATTTDTSASSTPSASASVSTEPTDSNTTATTIPAPNSGLGQLVISMDDSSVDPTSVTGYTVGATQLPVQRLGQTNTFYVNNIPPGKQDVIVTAGALAIGLTTATNDLGRRDNGLAITHDAKTELKLSTIPKMGRLSGTLQLQNVTDYAGTDVYIPGTTYIAKSDADGKFAFEKIPVGTHDLYFDKDGYGRGVMTGIVVAADTETTVPKVSIILAEGPGGKLVLAHGAERVANKKIDVTLIPEKNSVLMMLSDDVAFKDVSWAPLVTNTSYEFSTGGSKTLYVRFADANGLESTPISSTIVVDVAGPTLTPTINSGEARTNIQAVTVHINATDANGSDITKMRVGIDQTVLAAAPWENYSETANVTLAPGDGSKTVYVQCKDELENMSAVANATIILDQTAPTVVSVTPANNATAVSSTPTITVTFSEALDTSTTTISSAQLFNGATPLDISISDSGSTLVLTTNSDLEPFTTYQVHLATTIKDVSGNSLAAIYTSQFTTDHAWTTPQSMGVASTNASGAQLAVTPNDTVAMIWYENNSMKSKIYLPGSGWQAKTDLSNAGATAPTFKLAACGNNSFVALWHDNSTVKVSRYVAGAWITSVNFATDSSDMSTLALDCDKGNTNKAIAAYKTGSPGHLTGRYFDGTSWSSGVALETSFGNNGPYSAFGAMTSTGKGMFTWTQNDGTAKILANYFNGTTFEADATVVDSDAASIDNSHPGFDSSGNALVVYSKGPGCPSAGGLVWSKKYVPAGSGWAAAVVVDKDNSDCTRNNTTIPLSVTPNGNAFTFWGAGSASQTPTVNQYVGGSWNGSNDSLNNDFAMTGASQIIAKSNTEAFLVWGESGVGMSAPKRLLFSKFSSGSWSAFETAVNSATDNGSSVIGLVMDSTGTVFLSFQRDTLSGSNTYPQIYVTRYR